MKGPLTRAILVLALLYPSLAPAFTLTTWQYDGLPISTAFFIQQVTDCIPDGSGGVFVVWQDRRSFEWDIYIQRVNEFGTTMWAIDGVAVCTAAGNQYDPRLVLDGAGGVIVSWGDERSGSSDIYAQRVSAVGAMQWTVNGVPVCTTAGDQYTPLAITDGAGGAIMVWEDYQGVPDIYAQRINASGSVMWTPGGVVVCNAAGYQTVPQGASDGSGGVIVVWKDDRGGSTRVYGQRVNSAGASLWTANGIAVSNGAISGDARMAPDGAGGAVVTWSEWIGGAARYGAIAQRVDALGTLTWNYGGTLLCLFGSNQQAPEIVSDGTGGAIAVWEDNRNGIDLDLYAQRVSATGNTQWDGNGVAICTAWNDQSGIRMVADGSGGAVVLWEDSRLSAYTDIFAQRINAYGSTKWDVNGVAVCTASGHQFYPLPAIDGDGDVIVAWQDGRAQINGDVYAQRIEDRYGLWGRPEPVLSTVADVPADQGGKVRVNWFPSGRDILNEQFISHYSIWRAASAAAVEAATLAGVPRVGLADVGEAFAGAAIREEETALGTSFWELVGTQDAIYLEAYSLTASTGYDSSAAGPAVHDFQVIAHAYWSQYVNWPSNVVSGYSVDNLAPPAPLFLTANRVGADVRLKWNRVRVPDFRNYAVYRATSAGVTPAPIHFLSSANDSLLVDTGAPATTLYYIVTAYDVHANQSAPSNEAAVSGATGVDDTPAITRLMVLQNSPNPFGAGTEFQVGLPTPSDVRVEIYDVAGRRVGVVEMSQARAGWQRIPFDGRDARGKTLANGVYFYRVTAAGSTVTSKMVIAR